MIVSVCVDAEATSPELVRIPTNSLAKLRASVDFISRLHLEACCRTTINVSSASSVNMIRSWKASILPQTPTVQTSCCSSSWRSVRGNVLSKPSINSLRTLLLIDAI